MQMKIGDMVECIEERPESSMPIFDPIVKGRQYKVLGVRDADLGPPKSDQPDEILIDLPPFTVWHHHRYFKKVSSDE